MVSTDSAMISACTGPGEQHRAGKERNQAPSQEQAPDSFAGMIASLLHQVGDAAGEQSKVFGADQGSNAPALGCSKPAVDGSAGEASSQSNPIAPSPQIVEAPTRTDADGTAVIQTPINGGAADQTPVDGTTVNQTLVDGTTVNRLPVDAAAANRTPVDAPPLEEGVEAGSRAASDQTTRSNPTAAKVSVITHDAGTASHLLDHLRPAGGVAGGYDSVETADTATSEPGLPETTSGLKAVLGRQGAANAGQPFAVSQEIALTDGASEVFDTRTPVGEQATSIDTPRATASAVAPDAGGTAARAGRNAPEAILKAASDLTGLTDKPDGATGAWIRSLRPAFTAGYHNRLSHTTDTGVRYTAGDGISMAGTHENQGLPTARMGLSITEPQASNATAAAAAAAAAGLSVRGYLGSTVPGYSPDGTSLSNIADGNGPMQHEQCTIAETGPAGLHNTQSAPGGETAPAEGTGPDWVETLLSAALQSAGQAGTPGRFRSQVRIAADTLSSEVSEIAVDGRAAGVMDDAPWSSYTPSTGQVTQQSMISKMIERVIEARTARRNEARFEIETSGGDTLRVRIALNGRFLTGRIGVGDQHMKALIEDRLWELAQRLESHGLSAQNLGVFILGGGSGNGRKHQYRWGRTASPGGDRPETKSQPTLVEIEAKAFDSWA